jgi:zinc/manganese transport system substrate-binding protein
MKTQHYLITLLASITSLLPLAASADITVTTVHPILTDVARQVGGSTVTVIELMHPGEDVHHFDPSSGDIAKIRGSQILLASGKGMEVYLPKLQASLDASQTRVVEVGSAVRSIKISSASSVFVCCPTHAVGSIDPHWWHSISGMKKASAYIAKEFAKADPANESTYEENAKSYGRQLDQLSAWAKREVAKVPRSQRTLVTAHAAFAYFCKEFGFKSIPVTGLSAESVSSKYLAEAIDAMRDHSVIAVFPEEGAKPEALRSIMEATGAKKGGTLIADASALGVDSYIEFVKHNVTTVVAGLTE